MIKALIKICCIGEPSKKDPCACPPCKTTANKSGNEAKGPTEDLATGAPTSKPTKAVASGADKAKNKDKMLVIVISKMAKKGMYMSAVRMDGYCPMGTEVAEEVGRNAIGANKKDTRDQGTERQGHKHKGPTENGNNTVQKWKYKDKVPPPLPEGYRSPPPETTDTNIDSAPKVDSKLKMTFEEKQGMVSKVYEEPKFPQQYY